MMTAALERASPHDQPWIRGMQEEAFALAGEADRRTAIALAEDMLALYNGRWNGSVEPVFAEYQY